MSDKKDNNWMQTLWRPMMGWMYMLICLLDMAVFPVLWALWQGVNHVPITQWNPLTLQGAGLFHIAMGAVLGISAFGRTQEKLAGTAANPTATSQTITNNQNMSGNVAGGFGSGSIPSSTGGFGSGNSSFGGAPAFGAPAAGGFGSPSSSFGSAAPAASSFGGGTFGSTPPASGFNSGSGAAFSTAPAVNAKGQKVVPQDDQPVL
jgi:hypothetical protein